MHRYEDVLLRFWHNAIYCLFLCLVCCLMWWCVEDRCISSWKVIVCHMQWYTFVHWQLPLRKEYWSWLTFVACVIDVRYLSSKYSSKSTFGGMPTFTTLSHLIRCFQPVQLRLSVDKKTPDEVWQDLEVELWGQEQFPMHCPTRVRYSISLLSEIYLVSYLIGSIITICTSLYFCYLHHQ
jgi:hypothetical protein